LPQFHLPILTWLQTALSVVHGWFSKNAGAAFGILTTGSSIGGIIFPIMVNRLVRSLGFGWAMRISGFLILALLLVSNLTIRANYRPIPQKITRRQLIQPFRERSFLLVSAGFFFFTLGFYAVINYLAVQVLAAGMNPDLAQYIVSILNSGSLFGRLSAGLFGDKIGRYNVFIIVSYMSGILILALWLPASNDAALLAFAVLFGFCSGAYVTLLAPLIKQISPLSEIGFRTGLTFLASSVSGLTTSPINGALLEASGGFRNVMIFSGVMAVFGTTLVVAVRVEKTGWKLFVNF
jgi:MFS family permease